MANAPCSKCDGTGWLVPSHYVCECRAGDFAWARWEGVSIEEYDEQAKGTRDYHGDDLAFMAIGPGEDGDHHG